MKTVDEAFIGTGPISVIDACFKQKEGKTVLLVDEKAQMGGAWVSIPVGDYGNLEIGCHIWSYNRAAYRFLEEFFDLNLIELTPQPYFLKGSTRLVYDYKHGVTAMKQVLGRLRRFDFKGVNRYVSNNPAARFPLIPKKYLYPRGGARDLQEALVEKVSELSIETALNTRIEKMVQNEDGWELFTADNQKVQAKRVTLTATSSIKTIRFLEDELELSHRYLNYTHFHIVLEGKLEKPCSYVRVLDHEIIHRISDITYQLEEKSGEDITIMLVGVFDDQLPKGEPNDAVVNRIMDYLSGQGFVKEGTKVKYAQKNKFETTYIAPDQIKAINEKDAGVQVLATTDLIYGVYYRLPVWT